MVTMMMMAWGSDWESESAWDCSRSQRQGLFLCRIHARLFLGCRAAFPRESVAGRFSRPHALVTDRDLPTSPCQQRAGHHGRGNEQRKNEMCLSAAPDIGGIIHVFSNELL